MSPELSHLIEDYQAHAARAVALLEAAGVQLPASNTEWAGMAIPQTGELAGGFSYFKHGYGCAVRGPDWSVDFDFGERGKIDGFCPYQLSRFAQRRGDHKLSAEAEIESEVESAVATGEIVCSGYILYYRSLEAS